LADSAAAHFLADHRGEGLTIEAIVEGLGTRVISDGLPLHRVAINLSDYRPEVIGRAYAWTRDKGIEITDRAYTPKRNETYWESPIRIIAEGAEGLRRRLEEPGAVLESPSRANCARKARPTTSPWRLSSRIQAATSCRGRPTATTASRPKKSPSSI
jgi:hypothetical protein